jgi:hypothetical protein
MNRTYAVARVGAGVRIIAEPAKAGERAQLMQMEAFSAWVKNRKVQLYAANKEMRTEPISRVWLEWEERDQYNGLAFAPGRQLTDEYNLFRGFPIAPVKGDWGLLRAHVFENICGGNQEHFDWLMTWCAQMFQQPGKKMGSAVVVRGLKGAGKSTLFDFLSLALGAHAAKVSQRAHVVGNFNAHHAGLILLQCEEAFWAGDAQASGVLKDLVTSDRMMMEAKGVDAIETGNFARLAMISNEDWVVPAGLEDERRFFVLECRDTRRGDFAFFGAIHEQMRSLEDGGPGGLNAMVFELMTWTPPGGDWNILRAPPKTEGLRAQALESLGADELFFRRVLIEAGCEASSHPDIPGFELQEADNWLPAAAFKSHYEAFVSRHGHKRMALNDKRRMTLARKWLKAGERVARRQGSMIDKGYWLPPLSDLRAAAIKAGLIDAEEIATAPPEG